MADQNRKSIIDFIEKFKYLFSDYIAAQLLSPPVLALITEVMDRSGKQPSEAVLLLLHSIKYLSHDERALELLEQRDGFRDFLTKHDKTLLEMGIERKVQYNLPERGLPILEILGQVLKDEQIIMIELGASYGLIGVCLLNHNVLLENKQTFFAPGQQMPVNPRGVNEYIGIEIDPPDREWVLSCTDDPEEAGRIRLILDHNRIQNRVEIIKASMMGFSRLKAIKDFSSSGKKIVVLTSFVLYQFERKMRDELEQEIFGYINPVHGLWIDQSVDTGGDHRKEHYMIKLNGKKIIELPDDRCSKWKWIDKLI
jgi:hypothetical protein